MACGARSLVMSGFHFSDLRERVGAATENGHPCPVHVLCGVAAMTVWAPKTAVSLSRRVQSLVLLYRRILDAIHCRNAAAILNYSHCPLVAARSDLHQTGHASNKIRLRKRLRDIQSLAG